MLPLQEKLKEFFKAEGISAWTVVFYTEGELVISGSKIITKGEAYALIAGCNSVVHSLTESVFIKEERV